MFLLVNLHFDCTDLAVEEDENDSEEGEGDKEELVAGLFQTRKNVLSKKRNAFYHERDCSRVGIGEEDKDVLDVAIDEIKELIKDCFVTGKWSSEEDAEQLLQDEGTGYMGKPVHSKRTC